MSHRKFEAPRHGHLGFLPRKKCRRGRGRIKAFPKDDPTQKPHLTAFLGYKAGMTHIVRDLDKPGSGMHRKEVVEAVTIIETQPMVVIGLVGYIETPLGLKTLGTVWAHHIDIHARRRFQKRWFATKKKSFFRHHKDYCLQRSRQERREALKRMARSCSVIRVIAHTQIRKVPLGQKKAHVAEIQINGGTIAQKIDFGVRLFEKMVPVENVFKKDEMIDVISITRGHGFKGVVSRYGVTRLPRKTHKGLRKVGCIGAWHPARVSYTVARAGQKGAFHRCKYNNKIFMIGKSSSTPEGRLAGKTEHDLTEKGINPMGGFPNYGVVRNDFLMIKGTCPGPKKRVVCLRKTLAKLVSRNAKEEVKLKFIDTSAKIGHGTFQTHKEKKKFMGPLKKDLEKKRQLELKKLAREKKKQETESRKKQKQ
jgi:large subunit ribosomal protein L3e